MSTARQWTSLPRSRRWPALAGLCLLAALVALLSAIPTRAQQNTGGALSDGLVNKIEPAVQAQIDQSGQTDFWVLLRARADLSGAETISDWDARGQFVYDQLRATADASQASLRILLDAQGARYQSYWIANAILVQGGDRTLLETIAARPDVEQILARWQKQIPDPIPAEPVSEINTLEWNIADINADDVWNSYGVTGQGIWVANIDTGVQYNHPALETQYRGNLGGGNINHNYNWFDPSNVCGNPSIVPCDNNSHGTHTMGTMVGDDGGTNQIGVAPGAKWLAAKGCETNFCSDTALLASAQWVMAPTDLSGQNPRPDLRPHIVNNSWGGGGGDPWYQSMVDGWVASGIFPAFSNGNSGPGCGSSGSPGDYLNSYSAGAYDINHNIAGFSSRGPSAFGGEIKPNIAAPGVSVRSSVPTNGYGSLSGTSMASPHVAGTVALMWSADPSIARNIPFTRQALDVGAIDTPNSTCGGTDADNNVWGEGRLDAFEAVGSGFAGHLDGHVTDQATGDPIEGATVTLDNGIRATTDATGYYTTTVAAGTYDATASAYGWESQTVTDIVIVEDQTTTQDFSLAAAAKYIVGGVTRDAVTKQPIAGTQIEISLDGVVVVEATSDSQGRWAKRIFEGSYTLLATAAGYASIEQPLVIAGNTPVLLEFEPTWQPGPDSPFAYWRFDGEYFDSGAGQSYDKKVYFLGGRLADGGTDGTIWRYDPLTGTFAQTGATLPIPISNYTVNLLQDSTGLGLYVFGGRDSAGIMRSEVQVYYPATNSTAIISSDPVPGTARIPGNSAVVNNKAYVFGGFNGVQVFAQTDVYDPMAPAGSRWTALGNLSQARGYILAAVVDGKIYAMGGDGWDGVGLIPSARTEVLDTANLGAGWIDAAVAEMPIPCDETVAFGFNSGASHAYAGMILTAGCGQWPAEIPDSFAYDTATDTWDASFPDLNEARRNQAGALIPVGPARGIFVFGGRQLDDATILNSSEFFGRGP